MSLVGFNIDVHADIHQAMPWLICWDVSRPEHASDEEIISCWRLLASGLVSNLTEPVTGFEFQRVKESNVNRFSPIICLVSIPRQPQEHPRVCSTFIVHEKINDKLAIFYCSLSRYSPHFSSWFISGSCQASLWFNAFFTMYSMIVVAPLLGFNWCWSLMVALNQNNHYKLVSKSIETLQDF